MPTVTERYLQTTSQPTDTSEVGKFYCIAGTLAMPVCSAAMMFGLADREAKALVALGAIAMCIAIGCAIWGFITALTCRTYRTEFKRREIHAAKK